MGTDSVPMCTELNTHIAASKGVIWFRWAQLPPCVSIICSRRMPSAVCYLPNFTRERFLLLRGQYSCNIWTPLTVAYLAYYAISFALVEDWAWCHCTVCGATQVTNASTFNGALHYAVVTVFFRIPEVPAQMLVIRCFIPSLRAI
jgi:hypothetical protein